MTTLAGSEFSLQVIQRDHSCPYCDNDAGVCAASLWRMTIDTKRISCYCGNDNYDCCPIFLARTLRSAPKKSKALAG